LRGVRLSPLTVVLGQLFIRRRDRRKLIGQAEIEHVYGAIGFDFDIAGLLVAMNDASLVRCLQRIGDLSSDDEGFL
jgi:hypothetical protein